MAKSGIDFFPLDVALDKKFELIEAEFGLTGFGVVVHLLQEIYGGEGYYIEWTEEVALLFARRIGLGGSVVSEIAEASIRRGMFDKEKYDEYRVLTSRGIQKRYFEAVSRRKVLEVDFNILLVDVAQICPNVDIRAKNVNISFKNADISKQSKVEKSRVKESRVEKSNARETRFIAPAYEDVLAYASERGNSGLARRFFDFYTAGDWHDMSGKPVKNWKQKFISWESRETGERRTSRGSGEAAGERPASDWGLDAIVL